MDDGRNRSILEEMQSSQKKKVRPKKEGTERTETNWMERLKSATEEDKWEIKNILEVMGFIEKPKETSEVRKEESTKEMQQEKIPFVCYNCQEERHMAWDCTKPRKERKDPGKQQVERKEINWKGIGRSLSREDKQEIVKALRVMGFKPKNINPKTQETKINGEKVSKLATKADKQEIPRVMKAKSFIKNQ